MSRTHQVPSYRLHKQSGQAVVTLRDGIGERRDVLLGKHGTTQSRQEYARIIAEWEAAGRRLSIARETPSLSINELLLAFMRHAEQHYRDAEGQPTDELDNLRDAIRPLKRLYGTLPAAEFSPLKLKAVRQKLLDSHRYFVRFKVKDTEQEKTLERWVWEHEFRQTLESYEAYWKKKWRKAELLDSEKALSRGVINARVHRMIRVFRWAVAEEIVQESVHRALVAVPGLQQGRTEAPESKGVKPVPVESVGATLPQMPPPVAAMTQLQLLTGMRAGEVMVMRPIDLNMSGPVWTYIPQKHKNSYRGMERVIHLGPQAQEIVKPFLRPNVEAYLFSPRAYVEERNARRAEQRKTKRTPSERKRKRKAAPKRTPGERYNRRSYYYAIRRACKAANVPVWSPLQLRHTAATAIRAKYGVEAAKVILGHTRVETSQIYAERDLGRAQEIMREIG